MPSSSAVLVTRPEPGASDTAARVAALGYDPIVTPALHIQPTAARLPAASGLAAILVTSGNAVDALPTAYHSIRLLAVGDATAARARAAGFVQVLSASGDSEALAGLVHREIPGHAGPLLLASGRGQGEALAATLRQAGHRVIRRIVYAAVPAAVLSPAAISALRAGRVSAALFFSAETARHFVVLARRAGVAKSLATVDAISIGQRAAMALGALAWRDIRVAARPNQDEMLALLR